MDNFLFMPTHRPMQEEELPNGMSTARIDSCYELRTSFNKLYRPEAE